MPVDFNQMARHKVETLARRLGTFKPIPTGDGGMEYQIMGGPRHGQVLTSFHALTDFLQTTEYRSYEEFGPNALRPAGAGFQRYGQLEDTARKFTALLEGGSDADAAFRQAFGIPEGAKARITRESYGLGNERGRQAFREALFVDPSDFDTPAMTGMPMRREGVGSILRLGYVLDDGTVRNLRFDQLTEIQRNMLGFEGMIDPKLDKRLSQYMSTNGMQVTKSDRLWNVSVMNKSTELEDNVRQLFSGMTLPDGTNIGDTRMAEDFFQKLGFHGPVSIPTDPYALNALFDEAMGRAERVGEMMTESLGLASFDVGHEMVGEARLEGQKLIDSVVDRQDWDAQVVRKRGRAMLQQADDFERELLAAQKSKTGVYGYGQFTGLRGRGPGLTEDMFGGQLKGHWLFVSREQMTSAGAADDADVLTYMSSWKKQLGIGNEEVSYRSAYFARKKLKKVVQVDVQSLTSFPDLFPADSLMKNTQANFLRMMDKKVPYSEAQREIDDVLDQIMNVDLAKLSDATDKARLRASQGYASRVRELMRMGYDPRNERELLHQMFEGYLASKTVLDKSGMMRPGFEVADTWRSGFMTEEYMRGIGLGTGVKQGEVAFSAATGTWVTHQRTFASIVEATGGSDEDDIMANMLRMDEHGRLKAILFRNPNETAEFAALGIAPDDQFVASVLRSKGLLDPDTEFGKAYSDELKKAARLRSQIANAGDLDKIDVKRGQRVYRYKAELEKVHARMLGHLQAHETAIERVNLSGMETYIDDAGKRVTRRVRRAIPRIEPWAEMDADGRIAGTSRRIQYFESLKAYQEEGDLPEGLTDFRKLEIQRGRQMLAATDPMIKSAEFPQYMNFRMVFNAWAHTPLPDNLTEEQVRTLSALGPIVTDPETGERYIDRSFRLVRHETAIDAATDASGMMVSATREEHLADPANVVPYRDKTGAIVPDKFSKRIYLQDVERANIAQILEEIAVKREAGIDDGFDPWLWDDKMHKNSALRKIMEEEFDALKQRRSGIDFTLDSLRLAPGHPSNIVDPISRLYMNMQVDEAGNEVAEGGKQVDFISWLAGDDAIDRETGQLLYQRRYGGEMGRLMSEVVTPEFMNRPEIQAYRASAQELLELHKISRQRSRIRGGILHPSLAGALDDTKVDSAAIRADMLDHITQWFEEMPGTKGEKVAGPQVYGRILALQNMVHERGVGYNVLSMGHGEEISVSALDIRARKWAMLQRTDLDDETRQRLEAEMSDHITLTDTKRMIGELRGQFGTSKGRTAADLLDAAAGLSEGKRGWFEKMGMRHVKEFFEVKSNRVGAGLIAAATGVGIVRSWARRKDRTPESLHGAPELPGGQPYLGPVGGGFSYGATMDNPPGGGVMYDVRSRGGDAGFVDQAQALVGAGAVSGNVYSSRSLENPDRRRERAMAGVR